MPTSDTSIREGVLSHYLDRFRCANCFARLPQIAMLHHRRARLRVRSAKRSVQATPSQVFTCKKSSVQTNCASAAAIGRSSASGERHLRISSSLKGICPWCACETIRLKASSRSRSRFNGSNSSRSFILRGAPLCLWTKPLNHSRKALA